MNCEQCEDQLLELLYGELPHQQAALVQSHADDCQACSSALVELKDAMGYANAFSFDEPPPSFDAPIMEAARSHVLREERIAKLEQDTRRSEDAQGGSFFGWLRGLMTVPQLAATGAMLAIVGVSIWMLREQTMQGDTAMHEVPSTQEAQTVEPIDFEQIERANESMQHEAKPELEKREIQEEAKVAERDRIQSLRRSRTSARKSVATKRRAEPSAQVMGAEGGRGYAPSSSASKGLAAPAEEPTRHLNGPISTEAEQKAAADSRDDEARKTTTAYTRGVNLYEERKYAEAARAFEQALAGRDARRSDTLFYLARSHRQRGDCVRAIKPYEAFLRENPKDGRAETADRELRDCKARIDKSETSNAKRSKPAAQPSGL